MDIVRTVNRLASRTREHRNKQRCTDFARKSLLTLCKSLSAFHVKLEIVGRRSSIVRLYQYRWFRG